MGWLHLVVMGATGVAAMRAALERGDLDEAVRQGALAGPAVVERALTSADRTTRLAGIAAAPQVEDRAELLEPLARIAAGPDRRTALPAAAAARTIARELARRDRADDLAPDDVAAWRAAWAELARSRDRWIELRLIALDTAAALDPAGIGIGVGDDLAAALHDPDPAFRRAAATIVPLPVPAASYAALADAVVHDTDPEVALGAAQSLCMSIDSASDSAPGQAPGPAPGPAIDQASARPVLDALGGAGLARLRALVQSDRPDAAARSAAARCLTADASPESAAAVRAMRPAH
ncbi:MAG TPA: hypothetical protein VH165_16315 [Kofleriaceae bacterium]|nr:hypothetical protein [Kofleriaceae bacterium]